MRGRVARWGAAATLLWTVGCFEADERRRRVPPPAPNVWTIAASAGPGGEISPAGAVRVEEGASQTFTLSPGGAGFAVADVRVDGASRGPLATYTFEDVRADHTIAVTFRVVEAEPGPVTIDVSTNGGGSVAPPGPVEVPHGGSQTFTVTPDPGYRVEDVTVDGASLGPVTSFTLSGVTADRVVRCTFALSTAVARVRLSTEGVLPAGKLIGGIRVALGYAGARASLRAEDVAPSGGGAGAVLAVNASAPGQVVLGLLHANGMALGEFASLSFTVPAGSIDAGLCQTPNATVIDLDGAPLAGVSVVVAPPVF